MVGAWQGHTDPAVRSPSLNTEDFMPSSHTLVGLLAFGVALIAVQSPYGLARAEDDTRSAVQAFAAQPSAVTDLRGAGGSSLSTGSNADSSYKQLQQDISSEADLATGDGQQRSVVEKPASCSDSKPVCKLQGHLD
jgi:hypothetical protein